MPAARPPDAPEPHELAAAERIYLLIRDLRRQREAWAADEDATEYEVNLDVRAYNRERNYHHEFPTAKSPSPEFDLINLIAAIIAEERERGTKVRLAERLVDGFGGGCDDRGPTAPPKGG